MFPWLSSFLLNPAMAIGAGAVAGPILIHILSKRRYRRIRWGAMSFLLEAQQRNRRRVRLEQWLLLMLRCLAVLLIALVMMRPFTRPGSFGSILGVAPRTERFILLDDSYSMRYHPLVGSGSTGDSLFARGRQAVERLAHLISEETPADPLTLILSSQPQDPVLAIPSLSDQHLQQLHERLQTLRSTPSTAQMAQGIGALADMIRRSPRQANAAVYVISDFQRSDWIPSADQMAKNSGSIIAPLGDLTKAEHSISLILVNVGESNAGNAAITNLVSSQPQSVVSVPARFEVTVSNYSSKLMEQTELSVSVAQHQLPPVAVPKIQAGQTVEIPLEVTFPQEGSNFMRVQWVGAGVRDDRLSLDNARALAFEVVPAIQILVVDGEPSNDPYRDEVYLLKTALRPAGRAASGNELTVIEEQELDETDLDGYHLVILANVSRLGKTAQRNLETFVRAGGGLIIFAGDQLDIDHYNAELFRHGAGIMPAALKEIAEPPPGTRALAFSRWDPRHPVMRAFVDKLSQAWEQVRVFAYVTLDEASLGITTGEQDGSPTAATEEGSVERRATPMARGEIARSPARVIARFNDVDHSPAIVQKALGRGVCVFIATSVDQEWNDWASNFSYLPMMLELVQYTARPSPAAGQTTVNNPIICPIDRSRFETTAQLRTPDYPLVPDRPLKVEQLDDDTAILTFRHADQIGIYRFLLTMTSGGHVTRFAAVNPDSSESNLARASRIELDDTLIEIPFEYRDNVDALAQQVSNAKQEYWWPLLLGALFVLMSEHTLAWWFGTRG